MRIYSSRMTAMLAMVLVFMLSESYAQDAKPSISGATPSSPTIVAPPPPGEQPEPTTTTIISPSTTASITPSLTSNTTATSTEMAMPTRTPGPAVNPLDPGTVNCLDMPYCGDNQECFVLSDGLVCLEKEWNWGYILSRNNSGIPAVPGWSGPRSQLDANCTLFQMPESSDNPRLALVVYDLIRDTLPQDLLLSRFDQAKTNWYTLFSNCEPRLACIMGKCQPRPTLGQSCTSSWQCNAHALGLNENNSPIPTANTTEIRCEYEDGDRSVNTTCQLLRHDVTTDSGSGFSAWHVIVPVAVILVLTYFGSVIYQRRTRRQKHRKWSRVVEDDRNNFHMEAYDEIR